MLTSVLVVTGPLHLAPLAGATGAAARKQPSVIHAPEHLWKRRKREASEVHQISMLLCEGAPLEGCVFVQHDLTTQGLLHVSGGNKL